MGYTLVDAARRAGQPAEKLQNWEAGSAQPTVPQLRELANLYKRPLGVFYLPGIPVEAALPPDYRTLTGESPVAASPRLRLLIRRAETEHQDALELAQLTGTDVEDFAASVAALPSDSELAGAVLRNFLDIDIGWQSQFIDPHDALHGWIQRVERRGALVMQTGRLGIPVKDVRAFSLKRRQFPVILLNSKDSPRGRIFSLLHELAHLLDEREGVCNLAEPRRANPVEAWANAVAAAALMPRADFENVPEVAAAPRHAEDWSDAALRKVGRRYGASREAVLRRLLTIGKTTNSAYRHFHERMAAERDQAESEGRAVYERQRVAEVGPLFARLALEAFDTQRITLHELSGYIATRIDFIDKVRAVLHGQGE